MTNRMNVIIKNITVVVLVAVAALLIATTSSSAAAGTATGYVNSWNGAYVRSSASTSSSRVTLLSDNTKLTINKEVFVSYSSTSLTNKWYQISVNGKSGYIRADLVDNISYSAVAGKTTDYLNYRVGAGTGMTCKGTLGKGAGVAVYITAQAYGSSTPWYKVKVGSSYYYVCSTWVSISSSIVENPVTPTPTPTPTPEPEKTTEPETPSTPSTPSEPEQGSTSEPTPEPTPEPSTPAVDDFETYMTQQGFPESYKVQLRKLHEQHPNWVFIGKNVGVDWSTAVAKESANGVSLVESVQPIAWRSTDSNSFKGGSGRTMYSSAGGSSSVGSIANNEVFTILDEVWKGTTQWTHIKNAAGVTGYVQGSLTSQTYSGVIEAKLTNDWVNIRRGAGTGNSVITTLSPYTAVSIVLQAQDSNGNKWYKIKYGSGYAYIIADYVSVPSTATAQVTETVVTLSANYPIATAIEAVDYRPFPDVKFGKTGSVAKDGQETVIASVVTADGTSWYKLFKDGRSVYAKAESFTIEGTASEATAPTSIKGVTTDALNYRNGASTSASRLGCFNKGTTLNITGAEISGSTVWYKVNNSSNTVYVCGDYVALNMETAPSDAAPIISTVTKTSEAGVQPSSLSGSGYVYEGTYIPKDGSTWFNADSKAVAYFMDPRNFLNEDRVYMFEDLSYHGEYQTEAVVNKVLSGTALANNGFLASWFTSAGAKYNMSPVSLAARARQETGGGSIAISGYVYNGKTVYNPFNIGAYSSSNPVMNGIYYAYDKGWFTKQAAIEGGAQFIATGYINQGQNSLYFQRFNVANGESRVATHQYMTNLLAPYSESYSVKTTYAAYGITNEALTFVVPIYNNMPDSTSLPQ